ncbi:MAG: hypothetical protein GWN71_11450, partial [Gammaproteobacteria bacterium]|nr:hypothetical protein [Gemmatimonadota bacterium]NIU74169.1 hypothetical protein [Gammaproteobacteria bacterium]NIY08431.1 hypothetical protein [Gemmatimonadota bacterium]
MVLVEGRVDDERIALDGPITLAHDRNRIELRFAALSYRAPSQVRYQVRLGRDAPWSTIRAQPVVRWVDLPAGAYRAQVRASLDGRSWSVPATYTFEVEPPWYRTPQWLTALGLAAVLAVLLLYRVRVRHLLELERQRTRIAMDLHDEIGAALGSVGILAGVLGQGEVEAGERADLAAEIGETVEELGAALADIVWSLNPREARLSDLGARLVERGRRLFAGGAAEFVADLPADLPDTPLPARARRNVLLVGLEAMRNAVRHADAERVSLSMARVGPALWRLDIADDGVGVVPGELENVTGLGTLSMRRRA